MFRPNIFRNKGTKNVTNAPTSRNRKTDRDSPGSESSTGQEEEASGVNEEIVIHDEDDMITSDIFKDDWGPIHDTITTTVGPGNNDSGVPIISSPKTNSANSDFVHAWQTATNGTRSCPNTRPGSGVLHIRQNTASHMPSITGVTDDRKYPQDCYSFLAIYGPKKPMFFFFGMLPFVFQLLFLALLLWSRMNEKTGTMGEVDNPSTTFFKFFPANASPIVRCTQLLSLASYVIFPDSSVRDMVKAIQNFPISSQVQVGEPIGCMRFSCLLKFIQGFLAIIATLLLIATSDEVVDIILVLTALNFISYFDDYAFNLAMGGEFGPSLEAESRIIAHSDLPPCMYKDKARRHTYNMVVKAFISLMFFSIMTFVILSQNSNKFWVTETLRVQFQEGTGLEEYSGCFKISDHSRFLSSSHRRNYENVNRDESKTSFGYCRDYRQWVLFKDENKNLDPCKAREMETELARSSKTDSFDISTSFDEPWVSSSGSPLNMFFFDTESEEYCDLELGDGICNKQFNELGYQYDGGDCCADTCTGSLCGIEGLTDAFNVTNVTGDGFPRCERADVVPISIHLNDVRSSRDPKLVRFREASWNSDEWNGIKENEWRDELPGNPYFSLDCNGNNVITIYIQGEHMSGKNQTVWVQDGADCELLARNTQRAATGLVSIGQVFDVEPIWLVNYTVSYMRGEGGDEIEVISQHSKDEERRNFRLFPTCFFDKLQDHVDIKSAYNIKSVTSNEAMTWLIDDEENGDCENEKFVERYAVTKILFDMNLTNQLKKNEKQCTWPSIACRGGHIDSIEVKGLTIEKPIPSEIGLIENLQKLVLSKNDITTIPSEIGLLKKLKTLDLASNQIKSVPSQFGDLSGLEKLRVEYNNFTQIPSEIFLLKNLLELYLDSHLITRNQTELGSLRNLHTLALVPNVSLTEGKKTVKFPLEIGELTNLKTLLLDKNQFSTIPSEIGALKFLQILHLGKNNISEFPSVVEFMPDLRDLKLANNRLVGKIPKFIGKLKNLTKLDISNNELTSFPSEMGNLTSLERIDISHNGFKTITSGIGILTSLERINFSHNNLTSIPTGIGMFTSLRRIDFSYNRLNTVPYEIGNLTRLERIDFSYNNLTTIPSEIGSLTSLQRIDLSNNDLTTIPSEIGLLTGLQRIDISYNINLRTLPSTFSKLTELEIFESDLSCGDYPKGHEDLCFTIYTKSPTPVTKSPSTAPTTIPNSRPSKGNSESLSSFPTTLPSLRPSGSPSNWPSILSNMPTIGPSQHPTVLPSEGPSSFPTTLPSFRPSESPSNWPFVSYNMPTIGPSQYPTVLPSATPTAVLPTPTPTTEPTPTPTTEPTLVPTAVPTTAPTTEPTLVPTAVPTTAPSSMPTPGCSDVLIGIQKEDTILNRTHNELNDSTSKIDCLPTDIGLYTNLEVLILANNNISILPTEIGLLKALKHIDLSSNQIELIPSEVWLLSELEIINFSTNEITGTIPTELGMMTSLVELKLNGNELYGTLPTELGMMKSLSHFYISTNELAGAIPTELGRMKSMSYFNLDANGLTGPIPTELGMMTSLKYLYIAENDLSGTIPTELGMITSLIQINLRGNDRMDTKIPKELNDEIKIYLRN